ncbi:MAG TPA: hypothetical protein VKS79_08545 [Gemmataceae bacterium]|nr:hypothetical protein [Gemmataceae bacterium]
MNSRWHWMTALVFLAASTAAGQDSASHIPLVGEGGKPRQSTDLAQQLIKQMEGRRPTNGKEPELFDNLLNQIAKNQRPLDDPQARKDFLEKNETLKRMLSQLDTKDPTFQQRLKDAIAQPASPDRPNGGKFLPGAVDELQVDARQSNSGPIIFPNRSSGGSTPWRPNRTPGADPTVRPPEISQTGGSGPAKGSDLPKLPQANPSANRSQQRQSDFFNRLERSLPKSMGNSPALQRFVEKIGNRDLSNTASSRFWKEGKLPNVNWSRVGRNMEGTGRFLDRNISGIGRSNLPNAPHINGPDLPRGPQMASMGGAPSGGAMLELGKAGSIIVTLLVLLIGGFVLWRFLLKPLSQVRIKPSENGVNDWPVNPWLIRTREELVKAFDYLALLKCGTPAKMWHHHEVADHLGEEAQKAQAENLAGVYEQARYSPPPEIIPEPVMDRARQDLCLLAGTAAP